MWIRPEPNSEGGWTGYLWLGGSAKLKSEAPVLGPGCSTWYAIEPRGYVCVDGVSATLDANDPALRATLPHAPNLDSPWPHHYGESRGLRKYRELPTRAEQRKREWDLDEHERQLAAARSGEGTLAKQLQGVDLEPASAPPPDLGDYPRTLNEPRDRLLPLSTVAWSTEARFEERDFLLGADLMWVPKTRVAPYPKVTFQGVELGKDARLPLAFFRKEDRIAWRLQAEQLVESDQRFARLSHVELTGRDREHDGTRFLETRRDGLWVRAEDAVVPELASETPWGEKLGEAPTIAAAAQLNGQDGVMQANGSAPAGGQTWLTVDVWGGWLLAYRGATPVYATLISPGRGGTPEPGKPAIDTASTPTGTFKITGKFATATMAAPYDFIHSDVPWTQNFSGPHALHGAYWHDRWGERMSAGCINVSPIDGKWLFEFTEPQLPAGWHGVRWRPKEEPATTLIVR